MTPRWPRSGSPAGRLPRTRRLRGRARVREETGQALVIVLILMLLLVILAPIIVSQVTSEDVNSASGVTFDAALSAAEAGIQQYRNYMDINSNYWQYSAPPGNPDGDVALTGWQAINGTNPPEAFHYLPDKNFLGPGTSAVQLTVTGRSGLPGHYSYRTIQTTFQSTGLLTDAYFSEYETVDPAQDTSLATVTSGGNTSVLTPATVTLPADVPSVQGPTANLWTALCEYDTWEPNDFVDTLNTHNPYTGGTYNSATPYYGPWRGNEPDSGNNNNTFTYTSGTFSVTSQDPCQTPHVFEGGETFNGPVYTDDQLWVCNPGGEFGPGPTFSKGLEIGENLPFAYAYPQWPAQSTKDWLDDGTLNWDNSCGGGASSGQNFGTLGVRSVPHVQPQNVNSALLSEAEVNGCVYTGPTMIEFTGGGSFNVWSPESAGTTTGFGADAGDCGTFSSTTSTACPQAYFCTGLTVPSNGLLIYVNSQLSTGTLPAVGPLISEGGLPTGATCPNPWKPYSPSSAMVPTQSCSTVGREGDLVVGGELKGEVTLGSQNSIVVGRDLTYQCADNSASVSSQENANYSLPSGCNSETDVVGLVANADVVIGHPAEGPIPPVTCSPGSSQCPNSNCPTGCTTDSQVPDQTEPYEWPASTSNPNCSGDGTGMSVIADIVPDCDLLNPVIDGALVALGGSYAAENWAMGPDGGDAGSWVQGTDISQTRGPFGCTSGWQFCDSGTCPHAPAACGSYSYGYSKHFGYDTRLSYLEPPDMDLVAGLTWNPSNFTNCGSVDDEKITAVPAGPTPVICPGIQGISG